MPWKLPGAPGTLVVLSWAQWTIAAHHLVPEEMPNDNSNNSDRKYWGLRQNRPFTMSIMDMTLG